MKTHDALRPFLLRSLVLLLTLLSAVALAEYPLTVTDDLGREVILEAEPQRIVTMLPSHTETLCALEVCDRIVGIDNFSNYPPEVNELPRLGGLFEPDVEGIIALEPDLVLVSEHGDLAETLAQAGLAVYAGSAQTYEETFEKFKTLGRLVGRESEGEALAAEVEMEIEAVTMLVQDRTAPSVYYEIDATPYSVGPESFIGVLIRKAGGNNIVTAEMGDFPQLDPEFVVAADPEIIVLGNAPYGESAETLSARPGWAGISAVQANNVVELDQEQVDVLNRPGPRMVEAVRLLADIFHPDLR